MLQRDWFQAQSRDYASVLDATGYVLHITSPEKFAKASATDYQTALDVFTAAADYWKSKDTAFVVLVDGAGELRAY